MSESKPRSTDRPDAQADGAELPPADTAGAAGTSAGTTTGTSGGTLEGAGGGRGEKPEQPPGKRDDDGSKHTISNVR